MASVATVARRSIAMIALGSAMLIVPAVATSLSAATANATQLTTVDVGDDGHADHDRSWHNQHVPDVYVLTVAGPASQSR
jgi:hypothetical protein